MAAISCDICGGTLSMDSSGDFAVCDSCGTKHTKERMKTKAQEITGTVTVSNIAGIESLMKRGNLALEDSKWKEANEFFDKVLDIDAEYAQAYIGKLCVDLKKNSEADLSSFCHSLEHESNYQKAIRFADADYNAKITGYNQVIKDRIAEGQQRDQKHFAEYREKQKNQKQKKYNDCISLGSHLVGLKEDGTVVTVGNNANDTSGWRDIVAVACGTGHTVGLKANGTVVAVGKNDEGQCNTERWRDIVAVAAGYLYTVGLKADGTVVAVGENKNGQCNTKSWRDIVAVASIWTHTVGLKSDGTVLITPYPQHDKYKTINEWRGIVAVVGLVGSTGNIVGLKADGSVVTVGNNANDTSGWRDIVAVACGTEHTVGLKANGTVVAVGINNKGQCDTGDWRNIVAVAADSYYTVGLSKDGTVKVVGKGIIGNDDLKYAYYWTDIGPFDKEKILRKKQQEEEEQRRAEQERQKQSKEWEAQGLCYHCGGKLSGLLTKKCKDCGKTR